MRPPSFLLLLLVIVPFTDAQPHFLNLDRKEIGSITIKDLIISSDELLKIKEVALKFRGLNVAPQLVFNSGKTVSYSSQTDSLLITVAKEYDSDNNQTTVTFPKLSLNSETFKWQMNEGKFLTTNHTEITTAVNKYGNVSPTLDIICFTEVWGILDDESNYTQLGIKPKDICPKLVISEDTIKFGDQSVLNQYASSLHAELASGNVNDPFEAIDDNAKTYAAAVEIFEHDATMNSDGNLTLNDHTAAFGTGAYHNGPATFVLEYEDGQKSNQSLELSEEFNGVLRPLLRSSPLNESGSVTCRIDVRAAVPLSCTLIQYTIGLLKYEKDGDGFRPNKMKFQAVSTASSELLVTKMAPIDAGADGNAEAVRVSLWANQTLLEADINTNVTNLKVNELQVVIADPDSSASCSDYLVFLSQITGIMNESQKQPRPMRFLSPTVGLYYPLPVLEEEESPSCSLKLLKDSLESSTKKSEFSCRKNNLTDWRNAAACNVVLEYLDDSETGCSCEEEEREKFDKEFSLEDALKFLQEPHVSTTAIENFPLLVAYIPLLANKNIPPSCAVESDGDFLSGVVPTIVIASFIFAIILTTTVNYFRRSGRGNYQTPSVAAKTSEMAHLRTSKE